MRKMVWIQIGKIGINEALGVELWGVRASIATPNFGRRVPARSFEGDAGSHHYFLTLNSPPPF